MTNIKMKDITVEERPYERCKKLGVLALTDTELLALILRNGNKNINVLQLAKSLLYSKGIKSPLNKLIDMSFEELKSIKGIGDIKAMQIMALVELSKRMWLANVHAQSLSFDAPDVVASHYMQDMRHLKKEEVRVAFLDTKQNFISDITVTVGTVDSSLVSIREILIETLKHNAVNIVMVHNHPSGDPTPSKADFNVTKAMDTATQILGIRLNDHIIIGDNTYYSFREQGEL